ncbi:MAG: class I SAM-dependent methyltransferase [Acidimicrobiales bacterium]|jgi:SAM-dependent methyltransferase
MPELREVFDRDADLYDRIRPKYPAALFEELFSRLPDSPDVLEVGPGTGQATGALLARKARVTAVELGLHLSELLRKNFQTQVRLEVILSSFEEVQLEPCSFDAVVSATAYHWIDEPVRLTKPAQLLRPGGWLAVIDTVPVQASTDHGFFDRSQAVYDRYGDTSNRPTLPVPDDATSFIVPDLERSENFGAPALYRYRWDQTYETTAYIDLLRSFSATHTMERAPREAFLLDMNSLIEDEFDGYVTRPLVITLVLAQLLRGSP